MSKTYTLYTIPSHYTEHTPTFYVLHLESRVSGLISSTFDISLLGYGFMTLGDGCPCFDRSCMYTYDMQKLKISSSDIRPFKMKPLNCLETSRTSQPVSNAEIIKA